MKKMIIRG